MVSRTRKNYVGIAITIIIAIVVALWNIGREVTRENAFIVDHASEWVDTDEVNITATLQNTLKNVEILVAIKFTTSYGDEVTDSLEMEVTVPRGAENYNVTATLKAKPEGMYEVNILHQRVK